MSTKLSVKKAVENLSELQWDDELFDQEKNNFDDRFYENKHFFLIAAWKNPIVMKYARDEWKCDKEFIIALACHEVDVFKWINEKDIGDDLDLLESIVRKNYSSIVSIPEKYTNDTEFLSRFSWTSDAHILAKLISEKSKTRHKDDRSFVEKALRNCGQVYNDIPDTLKNDVDLIKIAMVSEPGIYTDLSDELRANPEIIDLAFSNGGSYRNYECIPDKLKNDRDIAKKAIRCSGGAYKIMPEELKADRELALMAIIAPSSYGVIDELPDELLCDQDFMFTFAMLSASDFDEILEANSNLKKLDEFKILKKEYN